jgi:hypothetical protein
LNIDSENFLPEPVMRLILALLLATLTLSACADDPATVKRPGADETPRGVCLAALRDNNATKAVNNCDAACKADPTDKEACGAKALAHMQSIVDEVSKYVGLLKPPQAPQAIGAAAKSEVLARAEYQKAIDLRNLINEFAGTIIHDLHGIHDGVFYAVGGTGSVEVPLDELPLNPNLLTIIYGRAETLGVKGRWTDKELALLGAGADAALAAVDLIMAHDLSVDLNDVPDMNGAIQTLAVAAQILNDNPQLLRVDDPDTLALSRDELHGMAALLAGRDKTRANVAQNTPGFLGLVQAEFAAKGKGSGKTAAMQLTDIDHDGTLSRGDNIVFVLEVNGEDVNLGTIYPLSAKLTDSIFGMLADINANMDGNKVPVHVAPLYNSIIKELGVFANAVAAAGVNIDTMPDAIALDFDGFYTTFKGVRTVLPYWYQDDSTDGVGANPAYLENPDTGLPATNATANNPHHLLWAFEEEKAADTSHFYWAASTQVTWFDTSARPVGFAADGMAPDSGYYVLLQDPTLAHLLAVNTSPFLTAGYGMSANLSTDDEFIAPKDNRMTNAVINAMLVWWKD